MATFEKLFAAAQRGRPAVRAKYDREPKLREVERFSRADDDRQSFEAARIPEVYDRIAVEDQTLIGGLVAEEVLAAVDTGVACDGLVAEVAMAYGSRAELADVEDFTDSPMVWELR